MENSQQIEDRSMGSGETIAEASEEHRPQNDFRNENEDDFEDPSPAQSKEHDKDTTSPSNISSESEASGKLEVEDRTSVNDLDASIDESENEEESEDMSELIRMASAAAIQAATKMKKSDSDLSESSNENDEDDDILEELLDEDIISSKQHDSAPPRQSMSSEYMEQASFEASLIEDERTKMIRTQLKPSGRLGRVANRSSSLGIINVDGEVEQDGETTGMDPEKRSSQRKLSSSQRLSEFETFRSLKSLRNINVSKDSFEEIDEEHKVEGDWVDSQDSEKDTLAAESSSTITDLLSECGINVTNHLKDGVDQEILLLHVLFDGFCRPPLPMYFVRKIVESERRRRNSDADEKEYSSVELPVGIVVQRPSRILLNILTRKVDSSEFLQLEKLPPVFVSSLFRILLRLLEGHTDSQYDSCVILVSCPWQNEAQTIHQKESVPKVPQAFLGTTTDATANANLMYSVVRLRMGWQNPIKTMLLAIESILFRKNLSQKRGKSYLLFPMIRLVGILCAGGVSVEELRKMIAIASDKRLPVTITLLMTRALSVAASTTAPATITPRSLNSPLVVLGKANPRNIFSFVSGAGITRTINLDDQQQAPWPFRNDFGAAFQFRIEDFSSPSTKENKFILLQALNETGSGIQICLEPLKQSTVAVLVVKTMENYNSVASIKVNNCPLHPRVWYHFATRHTRSRLKGMFSLSSREQLTIFLDGKPMLTEPMKFPQIKQNYGTKQTLFFSVGKNLDGQMGPIYIFRENVSDATFKALFALTSSESTVSNTGGKETVPKRGSDFTNKSHQNNESARKLSREIQGDDLEHLSFSHDCRSSIEEESMVCDVVDLNEKEENGPLAKSSFSSRLYISWNPRRKEKSSLMELHSGAHASLSHDLVEAVCISNAQQVIGSIGGIQSLLPIFESLLSQKSLETAHRKEIYSLVPDLLILLSSFVRGNFQNARELLRCGGIDIVEKLLLENKIRSMNTSNPKKYTIIRSLFTLPTLSKFLVQTLMEFRSSCSHYPALEQKVFSALVFNVPLWFEREGLEHGVSLYRFLLPTLTYIVNDDPAKVRDCVGATSMISYAANIVEMLNNDGEQKSTKYLFLRDATEIDRLVLLTSQERDYIIDTLYTWLFQIFLTGPSEDDISALIRLLSNYLEYEWEEAVKDISDGNRNAKRSQYREQRYDFLKKACKLLYCSLELNPSDRVEVFARACGSTDGGAAWLLSALVNSYCDEIRSIGIRCLSIYMRAAAHGPDLPLSFPSQTKSLRDKIPTRKTILSGPGKLQENAMTLISNVGHNILNANETKEKNVSGVSAQSKLTPRVIYKLLWHLLKSHRYRMGEHTQAALIHMVFKKDSPFASGNFSRKKLIRVNSSISPQATEVAFDWIDSFIANNSSIGESAECIPDPLSMNTILRTLRFISSEYACQWLSHLVKLCKTNQRATAAVAAACVDWQSSLFQFISETIEKMIASASTTETKQGGPSLVENNQQASGNGLNNGFELSLELYSILFGWIIRNDGEKAVIALEEATALQRVYVNGSEVFALILSHILANTSRFGVVPLHLQPTFKLAKSEEDPSALLKSHAKMVTDAILSNGARGMKLSTAMACWKFVKYLVVVTSAFVSCLDPDEDFCVKAKKDKVTSGIFGDLLPEGVVEAFEFKCLLNTYEQNNDHGQDSKLESVVRNDLLQRISVHVAAQLLSILDAFIFPEDSLLDLKSSQLQGLALVRGTENQLGNTQGPLLASLIRDSLLLLCKLDPSSVKMLQCCSRLRCFLYYSLELVRESDAMERYSGSFNKIALPLDRLLLSSFIRSHFALQKCSNLLREIEADSTNHSPLYTSRESRKKSYRRIFRVSIELREILVTIFEKRANVVRSSLTKEAIDAFQSCMESLTASSRESSSTNGSSQKEMIVRSLLASNWVNKYEVKVSQKFDSLPLTVGSTNILLADENSFTQDLRRDSSEIEKTFQKSLNASFEEYLEKQRKWAETDAVRDLEFEGDTLLKTLSAMCKQARKPLSKNLAELSAVTSQRWSAIEKRSKLVWESSLRWKLSTFTDDYGRRILLHQNQTFDTHEEARYDLMMGEDRNHEENESNELILQNELSDLMKRNAAALTSYDEIIALEDIDDDEGKGESDTKELGDADDDYDDDYDDAIPNLNESSRSETLPTEPEILDVPEGESTFEESDEGGDEWARAFEWEDGETIVARFDEVMVVTLRYSFEGSLLLTTAGLYFHQIGNGTNVVSKQPSGLQKINRHWRLSGLKEVHGRRYMLRTQALELFFANGNEVFLNFLRGTKERNRFYAKLRNSCKVPILLSPKSLNPRVVFKKTKITEMWRKRKISNFDYLMALNRMAGRTFNDISQYPVFPWILNDYESDKIDLSDSRVYRDLSKPVGALNPDRLAILIERYQELESFGFSESEKFLYGSHYSSPGLVLHFMVRQEPFTSMAIDLQSGKFDCPDRLFFDLKESWKSCNTSSSDVKELIPELFTVPEVLQNSNHFPLGKTQKGLRVDDVGLPPWAKGSTHEFIRIHRLALESEYVSRNLQNWIDLVFGYKQRGIEAEKAWNIFHFLSYEGSVDLDKMKDEVDRVAAESHIQNFGQTPSQLILKNPHPSRYTPELSWKPLINNVANAVRLRCHTPSQQFGGKSGRGVGAVIKIHVNSDSLIAIYSDLKIGFFWWSPTSSTNRLQPDRLQLMPSRNLSYSRYVMKRGSAVPQTVGERTSPFAVGNRSFAISIGGYEKEQLRRRKTVVHSRLASAKDALYTDAFPLLVSCGYWDNTIKVHATDSWKLESSSTGGHRGTIRCIATGTDGGMLVTGGEDCTVRVWVLDHPELASVLSDGYTKTALGRQPKENQVLTCCQILFGHESPISCVALSSELEIVASGSIGGKVCIHNLLTGEFIRSFEPSTFKSKPNGKKDPEPVTKIVLEKHGRMVIEMGDNKLYTFTVNGVCLCSINTEEQLHDIKITGEVVVTGGENGHVYIRNLTTLKILSGLNLSKHGPIRCVNFTPEELNPLPQFLFIGSDDGMISIVEQDS